MGEAATNIYDFPINEQLLEEALRLKEDKRVLKDRLDRIVASQGKVSDAVFQKVKQDYEQRYQEVANQLIGKKQDIDRELATLYKTRDKVQGNLKHHKEVLEETEFRHTLGEFGEQEYRERAQQQHDKISKFESVLAGVTSNISRYESLFDEQEEAQQFATNPHIHQPEPELSAIEEISEKTSEDYFAPDAAEESDQPTEANEANWAESTRLLSLDEAPSDAKAFLTVVSGPTNEGLSYPIQGSLTFGRAQNSSIVLHDPKSSRQHAEILQQGDEYLVVDKNSSNGTKVNGEKITEHVLSPGDEINIGEYHFQFRAN